MSGSAAIGKSLSMEKVKIKRPGFLVRWFTKKLLEGAEYQRNQNQFYHIAQEPVSPNIDQLDRAMQFTIFTATGGRVVEIRRYDRKTDRNSNSLYVITSDQDFGREIDKIITMEALK